MTIFERALEFVEEGMTVGLGSGRASHRFIELLGARVRAGLKVRGVPTSQASADLATRVGVPLVSLEEAMPLDLTVDGADEVDPQLNCIKGYGRALVREKVVAAASKRLVILVGTEKLVPVLGSRGRLPVEVVPFAVPLCLQRMRTIGCPGVLYQVDGRTFVSDNGNHLVDCTVGTIGQPAALELNLRLIPGVVGTGLFLQMAETVLVGDSETFELVRELHSGQLVGGGEAE
jgi:ribose 5-phosphate isomerase A